jgi:hypothetical protein
MVRRSPWALALSPDELDVVLADVIQREVPAGQFVARSGDVVEHWMGLVDGYAKMSVSSQDGRLSTLTGVGPGVWFGEGSLFKREKRRYDVIALRASRVALLPRRTFDWLRRTSFPFQPLSAGLVERPAEPVHRHTGARPAGRHRRPRRAWTGKPVQCRSVPNDAAARQPGAT